MLRIFLSNVMRDLGGIYAGIMREKESETGV